MYSSFPRADTWRRHSLCTSTGRFWYHFVIIPVVASFFYLPFFDNLLECIMEHLLEIMLLLCLFLRSVTSSSPEEQLVLTQHTVAMDADSDLIWFANDTAPQREWHDSVIPLVPFYETWNVRVIYNLLGLFVDQNYAQPQQKYKRGEKEY